MRFPPVKAQPVSWAQTFHTRRGWIVQVQLAEPCCQQLEWYVQSAWSGLAHREWDLLNTILVPQSLKFRFKRCTGLLPGAVGHQSWHSEQWSHFLEPTFLISTSERSICSSLRSQAATSKLGTHLSFLKIQPYLYSLGERAHGAARNLGEQIWTSNQTQQEHTQISEILAGIVLPTLTSHTWAAFCVSVILWLATHPPPVWEGSYPGSGAHAAVPCTVQKAASSSRGGWCMAREGAGGLARPCEQRHQMKGTQEGIRCKKHLNYGNSRQK